ncbi:MAG: hypothetical protein J6D54_12830 [Olsenella sp.]|nr:hypothetical protein [Olsenella sp.]
MATLLFCVVMVALLVASLWFGLSGAGKHGKAAAVHTVTHDSLAPTYTYDGEVIRWYVLVDPDTSVQYLVNDRGGCCVRLDSYGRPMGVRDE